MARHLAGLVLALGPLLACLDPDLSPRADPGPPLQDPGTPSDLQTEDLSPDLPDPGSPLPDPGLDGADLPPPQDCGPLVCHDCFCEWGPACGGCFNDCDPVPPEIADCSCCAPGPCTPPEFPEDCGQVSTFQCGFQAACQDGAIEAQWHHHWFCNGEEQITEFACRSSCPHGCAEGPIEDWPSSGAELLARWCDQCQAPGDCEGLPHDACLGAWECRDGRCTWVCAPPDCVPEGGSIPVAPDAPSCCPGLSSIACDRPGEDGTCQPCVGAALCARCGDGDCGPGENPCNCPEDCPRPCLGLGSRFLDTGAGDQCCEGLLAAPDCDLVEGPACSCPKCACYLCIPCGDGICGPYEHFCNCPKDCPVPEKCLATSRSPCQGDPYGGQDPAGTLEVQVQGHDVTVRHLQALLNCCLEVTLCATPERGHLRFVEHSTGAPCFCQCLFDLQATLPGVPSGTWELTLWNDQLQKTLFVETVVVP
ncbi:MAG TPA: hypothetical protein PLQ97_08890 [Myxococcota bacterium]|nr:hypothetical protein [Myxococcota bacterium]HQK51339.1 hypothetical protein [Myxococcota bacterium]